MRKKTVEVPQVRCIAKFADVQFKEMNPWRHRGRFQRRRPSRRLWRYIETRVVDVPVIREQQVLPTQEIQETVQVPGGSHR